MKQISDKLFSKTLLEWAENYHRPMPWKGEKDPYLVWLSEVILQQTRMEQGRPYFEKLKEKYPTVQDLANAPEDELMRLWQGLGYYSRARNLQFTAQYISRELNGKFPTTYLDLLQLKGVGSYTAAAISSFVFGEKRAVVDGNVIRVLARIFGIETDAQSNVGKKIFADKAQTLIENADPAKFNQAIMDFGASVCTPQKPSCENCPFLANCFAFQHQLIPFLPKKKKKIEQKTRYFHYFLIEKKGAIYIQKRDLQDIWQGLHELPMIENNIPKITPKKMSVILEGDYAPEIFAKMKPQLLSHQKIVSTFWLLKITESDFFKKFPQSFKVKKADLKNFGFPKTIDLFLKENSLI